MAKIVQRKTTEHRVPTSNSMHIEYKLAAICVRKIS